MSASQENATCSPDFKVIRDTAPKGNLNEISVRMPTEQGATPGQALDSQSAMIEHQPDEGDQPQSRQDHSDNETEPGISSHVDAEIHALQQRLSYLMTQRTRPPPRFRSQKPQSGANTSKLDDEPIEEDEKRRQPIQKAPYVRNWAREAKARAESATEDREEFGKSPNNAGGTLDAEGNTMCHVAKDGNMRKGRKFNLKYDVDVDSNESGWFAAYGGEYKFWTGARGRRLDEPHPLRGVRPPTSIRPLYKEVDYNQRLGDMWRPRLTPIEWDTSDTDEWSTDASTKSRDIDYNRARLRENFEWEMDRLNAQSRRYRKHKEKKQVRLLADRGKAEDENRERVFEGGSQQQPTQRPGTKRTRPIGKYGAPSLNLVNWHKFRGARNIEPERSFAIDVLIGEPMISDTMNMKGNTSAVDNKTITSGPGDSSAAERTESIQDAKRSYNSQWDGQGPLPERIRINSKPIIENLCKIHGKELSAQTQSHASVVMLRPFRMLNTYAQDIRELCARLAYEASLESSIPVSDSATDATSSVKISTIRDQEPASTADVNDASATRIPVLSPAEKVEIAEHLNCLRKFVDSYISKKTEYLNSTRCEKIVFSDIWYLFTPGTLVISSNGKQAYRVASLRSQCHKGTDRWPSYRDFGSSKQDKHEYRDDLTIKCIFVHYDGRNLGPVVKTFSIGKFDGEKDVTSLDIYPLRFHIIKQTNERPSKWIDNSPIGCQEQELESGIRAFQERLIQRGRLFVSAAGIKHMYYSGLAVDTRDDIESQVMLDFEEAYAEEYRKDWRPNIRRLIGTVLDPGPEEGRRGCDAPCCWQETIHDDSYMETNSNLAFMNMMAEVKDVPSKLPSVTILPRPLKEAKTGVNTLTEDELVILSYSVPGFILRDRSWARLDLDNLFELRHTSEVYDDLDDHGGGAFDQLVLPPGHKKMVVSLISQHIRNKKLGEDNDQVDIVRGKGQGLIILLHGAPGVGKTTTAEGVAEIFKKPLFQITSGDLGSTPKEVEVALQSNFALANKWGCILLLEEADLFLAERKREDFNRNGMVVVFLRLLEYYTGILLLTTNRIGDFDEAFVSRIHMSLHYPVFDEDSTAQVFALNLNLIKEKMKARGHTIMIEQDEIIASAREHWRMRKQTRWNGRQIRNACQMALALAEYDAQPQRHKLNVEGKSATEIHLRSTHFKVVSNAHLEFTEDLRPPTRGRGVL